MAVEVVRVVSALLAGSTTVKERLLKADVYSRLAEALRALGDPKRPLLRALLALACEDDGLSSTESESPLKVRFKLLAQKLILCSAEYLNSCLVIFQILEWSCTAYIAPMAPCRSRRGSSLAC